MKRHFAIPLGLLALGLAAQASAVTVSFHFLATGNPLGSPANIATTSVTNEMSATVNATGLTYNYDAATGDPFNLGIFNGTGVLSLTGGTLNFSFSAVQTNTGDLTGAVLSFSGGTGTYTGATGSGVFSHSYVGSNDVQGQFEADVTPVPEPASLLALGVGGVAVLRRRSRKVN